MIADPFVSVAGIIIVGVASLWLAWRLRVPSILVLLLTGFIVGPFTGWLDPDALAGQLLAPFVSLSVGLILLEGGMSLKLRELKDGGHVVRSLVTTGALVTWAIAGYAAYVIFDLPPAVAILTGAILIVTGPTVVGPLLQHIRPSSRVGGILKWEGIAIDPIGALAAVLVYEVLAISEPGDAALHIALAVGKTIVIGGGSGVLAAFVLVQCMKRFWAPDSLHNPLALMFAVGVFALCNRFQHESGLLATTVMGLVLANQKSVDLEPIIEFKENVRVLLISALFILLAARLDIQDLAKAWKGGIVFLALLVLVARPLCVYVSTWRSGLSWREKAFIAWMAPRGIVAAAVASVFAIRLEEQYEAAALIVPIVFMVIIGTVAIYGLTAPLAARHLGVADSKPQGLLIAGGHAWARAIAKTLADKGISVCLVDTNRDHTAAARMQGLRTYTGNIVAEHTLEELDYGGLGRFLALTPNDWVNTLAVRQFRRIFGRAACYQLPSDEESRGDVKTRAVAQGRRPFVEGASYASIEHMFAEGAIVKATKLSEEFNYDAFCTLYGDTALPLFVLQEDGRLSIPTQDAPFNPPPRGTLIAIVSDSAAAAGAT